MTDCLAHLGIETGRLSAPDVKIKVWCAHRRTLFTSVMGVPWDVYMASGKQVCENYTKDFALECFGDPSQQEDPVYMGWEKVE